MAEIGDVSGLVRVGFAERVVRGAVPTYVFPALC